MRRLAVLLLLFCTSPAQALDVAGLRVESIDAAGWRAEGLQLQIYLTDAAHDQPGSGRILIQAIHLPEPVGSLRNLQLDCAELVFDAGRIACLDAPLSADWAWLDKPRAQASFEYIAASGEVHFALRELAALGGKVAMQLQLRADGWQADAKLQSLQAARLAPLLAAADLELSAAAGRVDGQLQLQGNAQGQQADFQLKLAGLTASDAAGELASEGLDLALSGSAHSVPDGWQAQLRLALDAGQLYVNPVFADASEHPAQLNAQLHYRPAAQQLELQALQLQHRDTADLSATGSLQLGDSIRVQTLMLELRSAELRSAYPLYLQPFLLGTGLDELEAAGQVTGSIVMVDGALHRLQLQLAGISAHDVKQRYSVDQLAGSVDWAAQAGQAQPSRLRWTGGSAYKLPFGAAELQLLMAGGDLQLQQLFELPLLGGALRVQTLDVRDMGGESLQLQFDGALRPLSLTELTRALGWPEFAGTLGGSLPDLSYRDGVLSVGGTLAAQVFDGNVQVDGLRIVDPFGRLPRLQADMQLRNLDLQAATSAFQFGAIEGRLHGDVQGLRLLNWQPVAFDARFYTPPDDRSRHRISQRAIENISSLGGAGAGAALSRGFMRFFENFSYDRLGIACRLADGVCRMGGIEDAPDKGGYYLVKGKLLPRIDVIGYATEVSWPALLEQLRSISEGEGPEVR